jgi:hypothetical protein
MNRCDAVPRSSTTNQQSEPGPAFLIYFHIGLCCLSLFYVSQYYGNFHIFYQNTAFYSAVSTIISFSIVSLIFTFGRFSFGYAVSFYFYTSIIGSVWLINFSKFSYDHDSAILSAVLSAVAFFLPAILIRQPIRPIYRLSEKQMDYLLFAILVFAAGTIASGSIYNFRLVSIANIYDSRDNLDFPPVLRYAIGITLSSLLPFAFAYFVTRKLLLRAALVLSFLLLFYPITLSKLTLFSPFWMLSITLMAKIFETRTATVLSLTIPILVGIVAIALVQNDVIPYDRAISYFGSVNFRMIAVPSSLIDIYNDFFSRNQITNFCQISILKSLIDCPYTQQLSLVMSDAYHIGNLNASLFATEGIASVGLGLAPLVALVCGLVIAIGNGTSAGLPPGFILISGSIVIQNLVNSPLTTTLLSNGLASLFVLWYVCPRSDIDPKLSQVDLSPRHTAPVT